MSHWTLENDRWRIGVSGHGAQMDDWWDKRQRKQWLWTAMPGVWNSSATMLFPVVGRLIHNGLKCGDEYWPLPAHGFLRQQSFRFGGQTENTLTLCCEDSAQTRALWPFRWQVTVRWWLTDTGIELHWQVENRDRRALPFALGWHPGFALPVATQPGWSVRFNRAVTGPLQTVDRTLRLPDAPPETTAFALNARCFAQGAVYFADAAACEVAVISPAGRCVLTLHSLDTPWLALWGVPGADLLCIEPLTGTTDDPHFDGEVRHKRGMHWLAAGERYHQQLSVNLMQDEKA